MSEMQDRLALFIEKYGEKEANKWAEMSLTAYIAALVENGPYKQQIEDLANFISEDGTIVEWVKLTPLPEEEKKDE